MCYFFFLSAKKRLYVLIVSNSWWKYYTTSSSQIPWKIFDNLFWRRRKKFLPSSPSKKTDSHFRKIWSFFSVKKFRRRDGSQFEIWLLSLCLKCRFTYDRRYIISIWKVVVKINFSIAILSINTVLIAFADGVKLILNCNYT